MTVIRREFRKMAGCTFAECIQSLRDGRAYRFYTAGMAGYFYKAPHPEDPVQTTLDGAVSAITHWHKSLSVPIPPVLMLHVVSKLLISVDKVACAARGEASVPSNVGAITEAAPVMKLCEMN